MTIRISAFRWVPAFAQGYVKDLRVRWALEEAGQPYETTLVDPGIQATSAYRAWQPFGQVPAYEHDDIVLFESGAIVLHIAATSPQLAPTDAAGRTRVSAWVFAALNSIEPHAQNVIRAPKTAHGDEQDRIASLRRLLDGRLDALATWLADKEYLEGRFTAGDLVMTTVLRELGDAGALAAFPALDAYRARCQARPAFGRALEAQMRTFRENTPA